jgi:hypothetical protein
MGVAEKKISAVLQYLKKFNIIYINTSENGKVYLKSSTRKKYGEYGIKETGVDTYKASGTDGTVIKFWYNGNDGHLAIAIVKDNAYYEVTSISKGRNWDWTLKLSAKSPIEANRYEGFSYNIQELKF